MNFNCIYRDKTAQVMVKEPFLMNEVEKTLKLNKKNALQVRILKFVLSQSIFIYFKVAQNSFLVSAAWATEHCH